MRLVKIYGGFAIERGFFNKSYLDVNNCIYWFARPSHITDFCLVETQELAMDALIKASKLIKEGDSGKSVIIKRWL